LPFKVRSSEAGVVLASQARSVLIVGIAVLRTAAKQPLHPPSHLTSSCLLCRACRTAADTAGAALL
jgi:hypothetical protein